MEEATVKIENGEDVDRKERKKKHLQFGKRGRLKK